MKGLFRMKAVVGICFAFAIAFGLSCGKGDRDPAAKPALRDVSFRFPIPVVEPGFSPLYLGQDKGIFANYGFNVRLEPGSPELNPVRMVAQGSDQFGQVGGPELLLTGRSRGAPLVGIISLHKDPDFVVLLTKKESGLTELEDLQGKRVGMFFGHISTDILRAMFELNNIHVTEVDVGFDYSQFIAGRIDACWAFRTTAGLSLPARGVEVNFISPADYGIPTQGHIVITTERLIREHPEMVQKFVNAYLDALAYQLDHREEAIEATVKRDPTTNREVAEKQLEYYERVTRANQPLGMINMEDMRDTYRRQVALGILPEEMNLEAAFDTSFVEAYHKEKSR